MSDIKQKNLIVNPYEKAEENTKSKINSSIGYKPIRLSTKGKLTVPEILNFRNYNVNEILELSSITDEEERLFTLVKCMNNMIDNKDVKCEDMHVDELTEIMFNIYFMFNNSEIGPYNYYIDDTIIDEKTKEKKENLGKVFLKANQINPIPIVDEFKEPINIRDKETNEIFKFNFPRIKNTLIAKEYVLEKYKSEKEKFMELEWDLKYNENENISVKRKIDFNLYEQYQKYLRNKDIDFLKTYQASLIHEGTLVEKIKKLDNNEIPLSVWGQFNDLANKIKFGIDENVTFICPKTNKEITRRFLFQAIDFIPNMGLQGNTNYDVSFGD